MKLPALGRIPILGTFLLVAACSSGQAPGWTFATPGASAPAPSSTAAESVAPRTTALATPESTAAMSPSATDDAIPDPPPDGALGYSDFAVVGRKGSYCYDGGCADVAVFPLPTDELPTLETQGQPLIFSVDAGEFDRWLVEYGPDGGAFVPLAGGGESLDPDMAAQSPGTPQTFVEFNGPPAGDWVVTARINFVGGGSASYAWHVVVQ